MSRHALPPGGFLFYVLRLFEIARVLVRFRHVARIIANVAARHCARSYHFVVAVWRTKGAECARREVLANDGNLGSAFSVTRTR